MWRSGCGMPIPQTTRRFKSWYTRLSRLSSARSLYECRQRYMAAHANVETYRRVHTLCEKATSTKTRSTIMFECLPRGAINRNGA